MEHIYEQSQFGPNWFGFDSLYRNMVTSNENGAHFVEVGSFMGKSTSFMAVEIINSGKKIKFDAIDTWIGSDEDAHHSMEIIKDGRLYEVFLENMKDLLDYCTPIRTTSVEGAKLYKDKSLDFVLIDAAHDYDNVKADILAWLPKVKEGGVLAGDDWGFEGVNKAVEELLENRYTIDGRTWIVRI